ncbi:major facilitator superfamily domain-containing protein [Zychaea mexicana]|uniref:major facilitator superfamily domain-containing protein n=1 Tax=Zychaea mexicana TaxID=64656 RepID=UPI0022FE992B|nr:major facilitator superfamily domain-containing protein [Zychaea mexicana]KAI9497525.1 major facilitator superfamily domain-containing protein [Zychaea mexicana]
MEKSTHEPTADEKYEVSSSLEKGTNADNGDTRFIKSPEERKLVKKINWVFMPLVIMILFVQFIDKSTLTVSALFGIYEDTGITHDEFGWLGSLFYIGYLAIQLPNQYLLQRVPISKYLGVILMIWGVTLGCHALGRNFAELAGLRFLLGFWEGCTYPAIFLLISTLYRRSEQVIWFGTMFATNAAAICIGSIIAYGIGHMDGHLNIRAWKWAMIIFGIVTFFLGFPFYLFLADKPKSRWFRLTPEEEKIVDERTRDNAVVQNREIKRDHILEALKEPRLYCFFFCSLFLNLQNGAISTFASQIINRMGFSSLTSVILNIPYGASIVLFVAIATVLSHRFQEIGIIAIISCILPLLGAILLLVLPLGPVQLLGLYLSTTSPAYTLLQTYISSNVGGYTKKIFYTSANIVAFCLGNFVGPIMMVGHTAPRYTPAMIGFIVADFLTALMFLYVRWSQNKENNRRKHLEEKGLISPPPPNRELLDLTDKEDLSYRYRL